MKFYYRMTTPTGNLKNVTYASKNVKERDQPAPIATSPQQFPEKYMMVAGFTWRGPTQLFIIPPKTNINAEYFIKHVLTPMFDIDIKRMYGREAHKVILHTDSATSHTSSKTTQLTSNLEK